MRNLLSARLGVYRLSDWLIVLGERVEGYQPVCASMRASFTFLPQKSGWVI